MRAIRAALITALVIAAQSVGAQTPSANPVVEHFHAYQDALARRDLDAAEARADAALAASRARDGDGGETAARYLDLAMARLDQGRRGAAERVARRAFELAAAHPSSGADPLAARLISERTQIHWRDEVRKDRLFATLQEAAERPDLSAYVHPTAIDLAELEERGRRFYRASQAWAIARAHIAAASGDPVYVNADLMIRESAALMYYGARAWDPRILDEEVRAHQMLHEVREAMSPLMPDSAPGHTEITRAMRTYARAMAWHDALELRVMHLESRWPTGPPPVTEQTRNYCRGLVSSNGAVPDYPIRPLDQARVGAVVVLFRMGDDGAITHRDVLAYAPAGDEFATAVRAVYDGWTYEWAEDNAPDCIKRGFALVPFRFALSLRRS